MRNKKYTYRCIATRLFGCWRVPVRLRRKVFGSHRRAAFIFYWTTVPLDKRSSSTDRQDRIGQSFQKDLSRWEASVQSENRLPVPWKTPAPFFIDWPGGSTKPFSYSGAWFISIFLSSHYHWKRKSRRFAVCFNHNCLRLLCDNPFLSSRLSWLCLCHHSISLIQDCQDWSFCQIIWWQVSFSVPTELCSCCQTVLVEENRLRGTG